MFAPRSIKHCRACGGEVRYQTPADDNRERATCLVCTTVHYENPLNVVGTLPVWQDQVLLCRRAIEPRHGLWTLPAGFMELGETTAQGALRETVEEAGARVELEGLYSLINVVRVARSTCSTAPACSTSTSSRARNRSRRACSRKPMCPGTTSPSGRPR
jgi:ADP-ribose pyrophosphatase YjhB (NUDIX family)